MNAAPAPTDRRAVVLVLDVANVVGSRPDGWWRDRRGASERLLLRCADLLHADLTGPAGELWRVAGLVAVLEGEARDALVPPEVEPVRASASGDDALVERVRSLHERAQGVPAPVYRAQGRPAPIDGAQGRPAPERDDAGIVVVTADRGLRARLPEAVLAVGPSWLRRLVAAPADGDQ